MATVGYKSRVKVSGTAVNITAEATTDAGDHKSYQVTNTARRVLSPTAAITVKSDGTTVSSGYTLDRLTGTVTFAVARGAAEAITIDGAYLPVSDVALARSYSYELSAGMLDASTFVDSADGWMRKAQGQLDVSGSIGNLHDAADSLFRDALRSGSLVVLSFYPDASSTPSLIVWARFEKVTDDSAMDALVSESVDFVGSADADGRVVSVGFAT